ncbi:uncharacterized protein LOC123215964 [Mangifera indica]|uniref:uncharacterized protein LOC123215964 n=1 Tax=Mangifera indica TaxID=29780 RepID=UPI001CFC22B4|nr:uncharacterized protein LOC123215964 [Mangifera indica]
MKDRGKAVEVYRNEFFSDYSCSSDLACRKHPQSSSVGICAYCLKDRLVKLVCSDCGEQRLSSCSCSEISSNRNSCTVEVGSVGRVSFLIENDKQNEVIASNQNSKPRNSTGEKSEEVILLKRSNSSCVEIKKKNGLWRIGRLFRKKRDKDNGKSVGRFDEKSDLWVVDYMGTVSRSRSLCSFRGGGLLGSEDGGDLMSYSGARSSISAARSSGVNNGPLFDPERRSGFSEAEPRKSGFDSERRESSAVESDQFGSDFKGMRKASQTEVDGGGGANRRVFSLKESCSTGGEDSGFIDLKFDFPSESIGDYRLFPAVKMGVLQDSNSAFGSMRGCDYQFLSHDQGGDSCGGGDEMLCHSGSCRITVNERGIKKSGKSFKGWRWIFKQHSSWISGRKKDHEDLMVNPS